MKEQIAPTIRALADWDELRVFESNAEVVTGSAGRASNASGRTRALRPLDTCQLSQLAPRVMNRYIRVCAARRGGSFGDATTSYLVRGAGVGHP